MDGSSEANDLTTCKKCLQAFAVLTTHLRWKEACKSAYTEEEIAAHKKMLKAARNKKYNTKEKEQIKQKQKIYNSEHKDDIKQKQKLYNTEHQEEIKQKQKVYDLEHKEEKRIYLSEHKEEKRQYDHDHKEAHAERQIQYRNSRKPQNEAERLEAFRDSMAGGLCRVCASCNRRMFIQQVYNLDPEQQNLLWDWTRESGKAYAKHHTHMCKTCYPSFKGYIDSVSYWRHWGHPRPEGAPREDEVRDHEAGIRYEAWSRKKYGQVWERTLYENQIDLWLDMHKEVQSKKLCKVCGKQEAPESKDQENVQAAEDCLPPEPLLQVDGEANIKEWLSLSPHEVIKKAWNEGMCEEVYQLHQGIKKDREGNETSDSDDQAVESETERNVVRLVKSTGQPEEAESTVSSDVESTDPSDQEFEIDGNNTKGLFLQVGNELLDLSLVRGMEDLVESDLLKLKTGEESNADCECGENNCGCEEADVKISDLY